MRLLGRRQVEAGEPKASPELEKQALFERLVALHSREICGFLAKLCGNHHDAEELAQDVFVKAHRAIDGLRVPEASRRWLFTIAVDQFQDWIKPKKRRILRAVTDIEASDPAVDAAARPPMQAMASELSGRLESWIAALPDRQRTVLLLHSQRGFDYDQIASILEISVDAVKMSLFHAREKLRSRVERERT